jgi:hypothetical protein
MSLMKTDDYKQELRVSATLHPDKSKKKSLYLSKSTHSCDNHLKFFFRYGCRTQNICGAGEPCATLAAVLFSPRRKKTTPRSGEVAATFSKKVC